MAGRYHHPTLKDSAADSHLRYHISAVQPSSASLHERAAIQHGEIRALVLENQRLAAAHVALKKDLADARLELRAIAAAAAEEKALCDARLRDAYERSLKVEADARLAESAAVEVDRVRSDGRKLAASRDDLAKELKEAEGDLAGAREGLKQVDDVKAEIESVRREIQRGRAAIQRENKTRVHNLEYRKVMEEKIVSMAAELEKLHAELADAEMKARAAAVAANPDNVYSMAYGTQPYPRVL